MKIILKPITIINEVRPISLLLDYLERGNLNAADVIRNSRQNN
jgi:hypothetical protein